MEERSYRTLAQRVQKLFSQIFLWGLICFCTEILATLCFDNGIDFDEAFSYRTAHDNGERWRSFPRHYTIVGGRRLPLCQCPQCCCQATSTAGTVLANTKLPLVKWFPALYFMVASKDGISGTALAKYIGATLKTAWMLFHKIRSAMGERENVYKLGGSVEMDEAFWGNRASDAFRPYNALSGKYCIDMQTRK